MSVRLVDEVYVGPPVNRTIFRDVGRKRIEGTPTSYNLGVVKSCLTPVALAVPRKEGLRRFGVVQSLRTRHERIVDRPPSMTRMSGGRWNIRCVDGRRRGSVRGDRKSKGSMERERRCLNSASFSVSVLRFSALLPPADASDFRVTPRRNYEYPRRVPS